MTVKQGIINEAIWTVKTLMKCNLSFAKAKAIYLLHKELNEHYQFAIEQEKKIVESLGGTIDGTGRILFDDESKYGEFMAKLRELNQLDVEMKTDVIHLTVDEVGECKMCPADFEMIDKFIVFED